MRRSHPVLLLAVAGFAAAGSAGAQSGTTAASLVADAASLARSTRSWHAEGTLATRDSEAIPFRIDFQPPRYARLELNGGDLPLLRFCDGAAQTTYYPALKAFIRVLLPQIGACAFPLNAWPPLGITLSSPAFAGSDTITLNGHPQPCQIVHGDFTWQGRDPALKESVTLCIDRASKRILRYQLRHTAPSPPTTQTYTFSTLDVDPDLPAALFDFQPPEGSRPLATIDWLTPISGLKPGIYRVSDDVSAPILTAVSPPAYPAEAALVSGGNTVALQFEIARDGVPRLLQVSRSMGLGLDEEAVKAVTRWRFQPAMSASGPVSVAATIFIHFMDPK